MHENVWKSANLVLEAQSRRENPGGTQFQNPLGHKPISETHVVAAAIVYAKQLRAFDPALPESPGPPCARCSDCRFTARAAQYAHLSAACPYFSTRGGTGSWWPCTLLRPRLSEEGTGCQRLLHVWWGERRTHHIFLNRVQQQIFLNLLKTFQFETLYLKLHLTQH